MTQEYSNSKNQDVLEFGEPLTEKELLTTFPDAKRIIPEKIKEWGKVKNKIRKEIKEKLRFIKSSNTDEFSKWFCREFLKLQYGKELLEVRGQIWRLKRLLRILNRQGRKPLIMQENIQRALSIPIAHVAGVPLKKCGRKLVGLCPLHSERHPSFFVCPQSNRFKCYGCNRSGDSIDFVRLAYGYSFKQAVKYLCEKQKKGALHESKVRGK